jgi:predicted NAD/FAD-dependent oxidoreductase
MADVLNEQASSKRGLYITGECVAGAHTGAACASGRTVARQIIRHWA